MPLQTNNPEHLPQSEDSSYIKRLLQKIRAKGSDLIDRGVEFGAEAGYPDAAAALGATASAAQDLFVPEDEVDLALLAIPGGKLARGEAKAAKGARRLKRAAKGAELVLEGADAAKDAERVLKYESLAERIARKCQAAEEAPALNYAAIERAERLKKKKPNSPDLDYSSFNKGDK